MLKRVAVWILVQLTLLSLVSGAGTALGAQSPDTRESIIALQARLQELGYFMGECDGDFDDDTKVAIQNFQIANELPVSGLDDAQTVARIMSDGAVTKADYIRRRMEGDTQVNVTVSPGERGKWVRKLQTLLKQLGYFEEKLTGYYGTVTENAVMFFQIVNGLNVNGVADPATITKLMSPGAIPAGDYRERLLLKYGDSGSDVKRLQMYLKELGYFTGECSGKFGNVTQSSVSAYQRSNGLTETGECDIQMRMLLMSGRSVSRADADAAEAARELNEGDDCDSVKRVKQQLTLLGFYSGPIDTVFDSTLTSALFTFQTANDLEVNGKADSPSRMALNSLDCISYSEYVSFMSVCEVQYGDEGFAVTLLQTRLKELDYYHGAVNGQYNRETETAVMYFQRGHSLPDTGMADEDTRRRMLMSDALMYADAEAVYIERQSIEERNLRMSKLLESANDCVAKLYEAGKTGPHTFSCSGLVYHCFSQIDITLEPTVSLQLEVARAHESWSEDISALSLGRQVFFLDGQSLITGIYVGDQTVIYAYASNQVVVASNRILSGERFEFIGSVAHF